ncbi:MAG: hypothetical protein ABGZ35_03335, partial [Planctomycetaceae bacterium]
MYFNWQYANNHGFVSWLFLGGVTSTAKAFAWPYFALAGGDENSADGLRGVRFSDVEDAELSHLFQAFEYRNEAMRVFEASANRKRGQPFNRENAI